ncbi:AMP-binding protein [uncultured Vagococcus sp.]|uniref:AMP-binding protein n=1 Tax=uncultured Vagococcus sp. TaxID=189676 RepID=UPI0028D816DE|nr:AMP-binding protein [uncultured Vagococcus sp.]
MTNWLEMITKLYGEKIAFIDKDNRQISYETFFENVECLAELITTEDSQNIILGGSQTYEWIVAFFAIIYCGKTVVSVDVNYSAEKMSLVGTQLESNCILTTDKQIVKVENMSVKNIANLQFEVRKEKNTTRERVLDSNTIVIIQTSGTTGNPKWVELSSKNILANIFSVKEVVEFKGETIHFLPLHHAFGIVALLVSLSCGCKIHLLEHSRFLQKKLCEVRVNYLIGVPMVVEALYKLAHGEVQADLKKILGKKMNTIVSGGAVLDSKYETYFQELGIKLINGYGITECSPIISVNSNIYPEKFKCGSVGKAISCNDIKIIDQDKEGNGEVCVRGDNVFKRYYNESTSLSNKWYNTKDIGFIDDNGFLFLKGRAKNMILLSNGENIYPEQLEKVFLESSLIDEAIIYEREGRIEIEVFSINGSSSDKFKRAIRTEINHINKTLPYNQNVSGIFVREHAFEKTNTNKIIRK